MENKDSVTGIATPWPNLPKIAKDNNLTRLDVGYQAEGVFSSDSVKGAQFIATAWGPGLGGSHHSVTAYGTTPVVAVVHCLNRVRRKRGQGGNVMLTASQQQALRA